MARVTTPSLPGSLSASTSARAERCTYVGSREPTPRPYISAGWRIARVGKCHAPAPAVLGADIAGKTKGRRRGLYRVPRRALSLATGALQLTGLQLPLTKVGK